MKQENPINMNWKKEIVNEKIEKQFGSYYTSNVWLYNYLLDAGITPLEVTQNEYKKQVWRYRCSDELRNMISQFRDERQ